MSRNIIAILRGIKPEEVEDIGRTIISSGISYIEVALNSPMPFQSIEILHDKFKGDIKIGAGTVTNIKEVETLSKIGIDFIVSPNFD